MDINITDFSKELEKLSKRVDKSLKATIKDYSLNLLSNLYKISPVDTGLYRSNHNISISRRDYNTNNIENKTSVLAKGAIDFKPFNLLTTKAIYIQNNVDYSEKLENGGSRQAPSGIYGQVLTFTDLKFKKKGLN